MADKFYFFTDIDLTSVQDAEKCFGPVSGFEDSKHRLCSIYSVLSDSNAYAISSGNVFVLPDIQYPQITFIIYFGMSKDSLTANFCADIANISINDLTNSIWDFQQNRCGSYNNAHGIRHGTTSGEPPVKMVDTNFYSSPSSSQIFINISN